MLEVFRSVPLNSAGTPRHDRLAALKSLDLALFIHAKYEGILRRAHVEANNIKDLLHIIGIIGESKAFQTCETDS